MADAGPSKALLRALSLVSGHSAVLHVGAPCLDETSGATAVDVTFEVSLPSEWRRCGESPSGVRLKEIVRFDFPADFPLGPPELSLRPDFNRDLPHMQPWLTGGRPVPCIYDGDPAELLHREGLAGVLNQTVVWLERAALGALIDPTQGWEPVRRDAFEDYLVADADGLRRLVNRGGGYGFLEFTYLKHAANDRPGFVHGQISASTVRLTPKSVPNLFREMSVRRDSPLRHGKSLALAVWPGKHPSGELIVNNVYLPETVRDVDDLKKRAALYNCAKELDTALGLLKQRVSVYREAGPFTLAIILLARRPFDVIGSESPIELCPYVVDICSPGLFADSGATAVRPAAHHHSISRPLLARMTGGAVNLERPRWTLVGAGSLGSKLALHLARAGNGPEVVLDKSSMTPHNAARHALVPVTGDMQLLGMDAKARVLCEALRGLDHEATPLAADVVAVLTSRRNSHRLGSERSWAVVNSTASLVVREAIAATRRMPVRVIETLLFTGGLAGLVTTEGPGRNPNTTDLMAEFYTLLREDAVLARIIFGSDDNVSRRSIGQGCGSLTMAMSDGRLSLFAAGMSEYLLARQRDGLPHDGGEILIGRLSEDGLGLKWHTRSIPPVLVVRAMNRKSWCAHIHSRALTKIRGETARWPKVETGGVLMGRISEVSRTVHVVDVLSPPEDSSRSADEFVLGRRGLRQQMAAYSEAVGWSLYCLGTWHSHLSPGGPSETDRATAKAVSLARLTPSLFLIHTPTDFHALLADATDVSVSHD